ncbi:uncharacterized protein CLUP02_03045 [Colletotrichum lupini]|uniref:Uncharacterized protein n=1 Tax=Colletotrichum lupini TaxID=145971 RepID=A0A9Q8SIL8_9PEZI|nr:uncharacterized protein CLUP02_03045 [Colletotrichum lupini]UQC77576.1 hypothetical protein CLUP02_03045 [Colletotrichum lupini]
MPEFRRLVCEVVGVGGRSCPINARHTFHSTFGNNYERQGLITRCLLPRAEAASTRLNQVPEKHGSLAALAPADTSASYRCLRLNNRKQHHRCSRNGMNYEVKVVALPYMVACHSRYLPPTIQLRDTLILTPVLENDYILSSEKASLTRPNTHYKPDI